MKSRRPTKAQGKAGMEAGEQYAPLSYRLLQSPAWRSLSGPAAKVFLEIRSRFNGGNNGKLSLSLDQGASLLGLSKTTVRRAFQELEAKGFLRLVKRGHWYGRLASTWEITDKGRDGRPPGNDWKHWKPPKAQQKKPAYYILRTQPKMR
jgi:biotin operon repressor